MNFKKRVHISSQGPPDLFLVAINAFALFFHRGYKLLSNKRNLFGLMTLIWIMTFSGNIADFSLTEIVQTISSSDRTGQLIINGKIVKVSVIFRDGKPVRTIPEYSSVMLGQLLIRGKEIDPVGLNTALAIQQNHKKVDKSKRLGSILLDLGLIERKTLNKYLSIPFKTSSFFLPKTFPIRYNNNFEGDSKPN